MTSARATGHSHPPDSARGSDARAEFRKFLDLFGDRGPGYFLAGLSIEEAHRKHQTWQEKHIKDLELSLRQLGCDPAGPALELDGRTSDPALELDEDGAMNEQDRSS
jgi:hypothetical protein